MRSQAADQLSTAGGVKGRSPLVASAEAKHSKLWHIICIKSKISIKSKSAIHIKNGKTEMRNQAVKTVNVNCAYSVLPKQTFLGVKCAERSDKHFKPTTFEQLCKKYQIKRRGGFHIRLLINTVLIETL